MKEPGATPLANVSKVRRISFLAIGFLERKRMLFTCFWVFRESDILFCQYVYGLGEKDEKKSFFILFPPIFKASDFIF